ncbi:hypothetical protein OC842_006642 [Tilletia horrida]|uniref:Uncharacterized protein n=1 Tax=Tilletia horrida TaxID=155126 RepID=A0AAN6G7U4_9BASI|nr:hypothetical protein OC842_006642 [Tilletia horrida]
MSDYHFISSSPLGASTPDPSSPLSSTASLSAPPSPSPASASAAPVPGSPASDEAEEYDSPPRSSSPPPASDEDGEDLNEPEPPSSDGPDNGADLADFIVQGIESDSEDDAGTSEDEGEAQFTQESHSTYGGGDANAEQQLAESDPDGEFVPAGEAPVVTGATINDVGEDHAVDAEHPGSDEDEEGAGLIESAAEPAEHGAEPDVVDEHAGDAQVAALDEAADLVADHETEGADQHMAGSLDHGAPEDVPEHAVLDGHVGDDLGEHAVLDEHVGEVLHNDALDVHAGDFVEHAPGLDVNAHAVLAEHADSAVEEHAGSVEEQEEDGDDDSDFEIVHVNTAPKRAASEGADVNQPAPKKKHTEMETMRVKIKAAVVCKWIHDDRELEPLGPWEHNDENYQLVAGRPNIYHARRLTNGMIQIQLFGGTWVPSYDVNLRRDVRAPTCDICYYRQIELLVVAPGSGGA